MCLIANNWVMESWMQDVVCFLILLHYLFKKNQVQTVTQDAEIESFIFGAVLLVYVKVFH
jgi:hypothetical protein